VVNSVFNVILGSSNNLALAFDVPYWLSVQVEGDAQLSPRIELAAAPYALTARSVIDDAVDGDAIANGEVVRSLNSLTDNVTLAEGNNVTITPSGNTLTIAADGGSGFSLPYEGSTSSSDPGITITNSGTGRAATFNVSNTSSSGTTLYGENRGLGRSGYFRVINTSNNNNALTGSTDGGGWGVSAYSNGTDYALSAVNGGAGGGTRSVINRGTNNATAVYAETNGTGRAGHFRITNPSSSQDAFAASTQGSGDAVEGYTTGSGDAVEGYTTGLGRAAHFQVNNVNQDEPAVFIESNGQGNALEAETTNGNGHAGSFSCDTPTWATVTAYHSELSGCALQGSVEGGQCIRAIVQQEGVCLRVEHRGDAATDGDFATFYNDGDYQIRFDLNGRGFFNDGTQTGGADLAEAFEVEGGVDAYEPGDLIAISETSDRCVAKSDTPYSTLVVGVYATKPGVLLTERNINDSLDDTIPVGVVGVLPTKVSGENGPIRRGDLLVASSLSGHAMKGTEQDRMLGAIVGKALQNFDGSGTGIIKVMVNAR